MPVDYDERTESELRQDAVEAIKDVHESARPEDDSTLTYGLIESLVGALQNQEQSLSNLNEASYLTSAENEELTRIARDRYGIDRKEPQQATGVVTFTRDSTPSSPITIDAETIVETVDTDPVQFETMTDVTMQTDETSVSVDAIAVNGGADGNVGPSTLEAMPSPPSASLSVTNPQPMGDPSTTLTDGVTEATQGLDRESDSELRTRADEATAFGGAASDGAIKTAIGNIDDVISVSAVVNASPDDNTGSGGLPPYSSEYIVYGGQTSEIIQRLVEVMTVIDFKRLTGGVNGTKETYDVYSQPLDETLTGEITRPQKVDIDIDCSLVVTDAYAGDSAVKSAIVAYIGGYDIDNSRVTALGINEDVVIDELESRITDVPGVRGISDLTVDSDADGDHDGTDDRTTDANGLDVIAIGNTEVAITNGADSSITISTTET